MSNGKTIGFVFIPGFADWEYGFLAAAGADWFSFKPVSLSPKGEKVFGISGFSLSPERGLDPAENTDLDGVAVIGSDTWTSDAAPDVAPLLQAIAARGGVVGGICAGTVPLAKAGLFEGAAHTSNGRDWLGGHVPGYAGMERYEDVPHAVADGRIVSAPGSAPGTFAQKFLLTLYPEKADMLTEMKSMFGREYAEAS